MRAVLCICTVPVCSMCVYAGAGLFKSCPGSRVSHRHMTWVTKPSVAVAHAQWRFNDQSDIILTLTGEQRSITLRAMEAKSQMTLEGGEPLVGKGEALEAFEGKRVKPYSERNLPQHNTGDLTRGESPMCADCPLDNTLIPPHSSPTPHMGGHCTAEVSACTHSFVTLRQL